MKEARHERRTANRKRPCKVLDRRRSARFSRPALDSPTKTAKRKSLSRRVAGERDSQDARPCSEDARFCGNNINNNNNDNNNNNGVTSASLKMTFPACVRIVINEGNRANGLLSSFYGKSQQTKEATRSNRLSEAFPASGESQWQDGE